MPSVLARLVLDVMVVALAIFGGAGTWSWPRAWTLLAVMFVVRTASAVAVYQVNPTLLRERAKFPIHDAQPTSDKVLLLAVVATGFVGVPLVAGLDVFRWQLWPRPPALLAVVGLVLFVVGWTLKALALRANAYATTVVRLQRDRAHAVVDTGVYRIVRHPFYAGTPLVFLGLALWLGSYGAAALTVVPFTLMLVRLQLEERFLRTELPGYADYTGRVPHRLIPRVW